MPIMGQKDSHMISIISTVPVNIDYMMHRNAEWTMLMLGESIFSILIVEVRQSFDYMFTFVCSILTVVFLYYLHFQSQPNDANQHALRRNKNAGIVWSIVHYGYSYALVALGAAFTFFLQFYVQYGKSDGGYKDTSTVEDRLLASGSAMSSEVATAANGLFCASLTVVFICLDLMTILHLGLKESKGRCKCSRHNTWRVATLALVVARLATLGFTWTLYWWEDRPNMLSILGLTCVAIQFVLRQLGRKYAAKHRHQVAVEP